MSTTKPTTSALIELIGYIESRHHRYLRNELPRLLAMLDDSLGQPGTGCQQSLVSLNETLRPLVNSVHLHMKAEEDILFPYMREVEAFAQGSSPTPPTPREAVRDPVRHMTSEHEEVERALEKMRSLTENFTCADDEGDRIRHLYEGLRALSFDLEEHMRLENSLGRHVEDILSSAKFKNRIDGDLRLAREIQERILPQDLGGSAGTDKVALGVRTLPSAELGGDFYEFSLKDQSQLILALGDVCGKGAPAALVMTAAWTLLRTLITDEVSPSTVLRRMHQGLLQLTGPLRYVTLFLGYYDMDKRHLRFANAGHCPPILMRSDGTTARLDSTSTVLGAMTDFSSRDAEIDLAAGERLFAYSDGITEACTASGDFFGTSRLENLVTIGAGSGLDELLDRIVGEAKSHHTHPSDPDDMTIWAMEVR